MREKKGKKTNLIWRREIGDDLLKKVDEIKEKIEREMKGFARIGSEEENEEERRKREGVFQILGVRKVISHLYKN